MKKFKFKVLKCCFLVVPLILKISCSNVGATRNLDDWLKNVSNSQLPYDREETMFALDKYLNADDSHKTVARATKFMQSYELLRKSGESHCRIVDIYIPSCLETAHNCGIGETNSIDVEKFTDMYTNVYAECVRKREMMAGYYADTFLVSYVYNMRNGETDEARNMEVAKCCAEKFIRRLNEWEPWQDVPEVLDFVNNYFKKQN